MTLAAKAYSVAHVFTQVIRTCVIVLALGVPVSEAAIGPLGPEGAPASAFPPPARPVATIISPIWHNETERDRINESTQLIALMGIKAGMTVADIGAGTGYYTVRLSPVVGPEGTVLAEDVIPKYLEGLAARVKTLAVQNVRVGAGEPHDPRLPRGVADAAILVHMYHEIEQPYAFLHNLALALKPGARVGILDAYRNTAEHGTPPKLLKCELGAAGYRQLSFNDLEGAGAYLAIFEVVPDAPPLTRQAASACKQ